MNDLKPKVGVGIFLIKEGQLLMGKRKGSHGEGEYALPGGHLEQGESFEECVLRELKEEAGPDLKVDRIKFLCVTNLRKYAPKHYVDIGMLAEYVSGEPIVAEPDEKDSWEWYDMDKLPEPLFGCTENYIESYRTGKSYFEGNL
ncbi:MAG TPA: NUDIX domain-containing protein [Candidatus Saccharimonadales bacterium]|nr:NUDIX domain-containing protein [Candidatus Saccharimonadales bacterium]